MPVTPIVARFFEWSATFDDEAIVLRPWLGTSVAISWDEVKFVCPVPTVEKVPDGWQEKKETLRPAGFRSTLESHGLLVLYVVVADRRPIFDRASRWTRFWLRSRLRPMLGSDDRFKADESLLSLEVRVDRLDVPWGQLLDLVAEHARFELVVFGM